VEATEVGSETQLSQITKLILQAQNQKAPAQILADRISAVFVPVVIALAIFTFLTWQYLPQVWPQLAEQISNQFGGVNFAELTKSLQNAIAVIVVACPCALGLATPIALMVAGGRGAQLGIVLRSPRALHRSSEITDVIFDKTGTLTAGSFKLINMELVETPLTSKDGSTTISTNQLMSFAMTIEQQDSHPIAKAIAAGIEKLGIKPSQISEFEHRPGQGVAARLEGKYAVLIGSPISIARASTTFNPRIDLAIKRATENGNSVAVLAIDGLAYGVFEIGDEVRAEAASALNLMSTRKINSESILAEISPQGKWEFVKKLQSQNKKVLMIGDGINDAASLAQADLSMAIGTGTATANAASDISLVNPSLLTAITALDLMAKTNKVIRSNLGWAFVYNLICIPLAATGTLPAMYAGIAMSLSSIFVSLNSLRVRAVQPIQRELSKKYKR
jgi:Cu+-exporting ATPase